MQNASSWVVLFRVKLDTELEEVKYMCVELVEACGNLSNNSYALPSQ